MTKRKYRVFFALFLASVTLCVTPSEGASIRNGVNCAKPGTVAKVGAKSYRCAKNPYVKPSQNTWTLRGCLTAYALWQSSKKQYENWADLAKLAGAEGQKTMDDLQASITDLEATMKDVACKKGA